jgi:uncharacterized protein (DUF3820 family)
MPTRRVLRPTREKGGRGRRGRREMEVGCCPSGWSSTDTSVSEVEGNKKAPKPRNRRSDPDAEERREYDRKKKRLLIKPVKSCGSRGEPPRSSRRELIRPSKAPSEVSSGSAEERREYDRKKRLLIKPVKSCGCRGEPPRSSRRELIRPSKVPSEESSGSAEERREYDRKKRLLVKPVRSCGSRGEPPRSSKRELIRPSKAQLEESSSSEDQTAHPKKRKPPKGGKVKSSATGEDGDEETQCPAFSSEEEMCMEAKMWTQPRSGSSLLLKGKNKIKDAVRDEDGDAETQHVAFSSEEEGNMEVQNSKQPQDARRVLLKGKSKMRKAAGDPSGRRSDRIRQQWELQKPSFVCQIVRPEDAPTSSEESSESDVERLSDWELVDLPAPPGSTIPHVKDDDLITRILEFFCFTPPLLKSMLICRAWRDRAETLAKDRDVLVVLGGLPRDSLLAPNAVTSMRPTFIRPSENSLPPTEVHVFDPLYGGSASWRKSFGIFERRDVRMRKNGFEGFGMNAYDQIGATMVKMGDAQPPVLVASLSGSKLYLRYDPMHQSWQKFAQQVFPENISEINSPVQASLVAVGESMLEVGGFRLNPNPALLAGAQGPFSYLPCCDVRCVHGPLMHQKVKDLTRPRGQTTVVAWTNESGKHFVLAAGGLTLEDHDHEPFIATSATVEVLDVDSNEWMEWPSMPEPRLRAAGVYWKEEGLVVLASGNSTGTIAFDDATVLCLDIKSSPCAWRSLPQLPPMPTESAVVCGCAILNSALIVLRSQQRGNGRVTVHCLPGAACSEWKEMPFLLYGNMACCKAMAMPAASIGRTFAPHQMEIVMRKKEVLRRFRDYPKAFDAFLTQVARTQLLNSLPMRRMPFGKYKGRKLENIVDEYYIRWLATQSIGFFQEVGLSDLQAKCLKESFVILHPDNLIVQHNWGADTAALEAQALAEEHDEQSSFDEFDVSDVSDGM